MIDMKRKKSEKKDMEVAMSEQPDYPYGLCLSLDETSLDKLDLDLMSIGSEVKFTAKAVVKSISQHDIDDYSDKNMSLQITHIEIDGAHDSDTAKRFYGEDKDGE